MLGTAVLYPTQSTITQLFINFKFKIKSNKINEALKNEILETISLWFTVGQNMFREGFFYRSVLKANAGILFGSKQMLLLTQ